MPDKKKPPSAKPLGVAEIRKGLADIPAWKLEQRGSSSELVRTYTFPGGKRGFLSAIDFMSVASKEIARRNHHPTWANAWVKLGVGLTTHDAGDRVTEKDLGLAHYLERLFRKQVGREGGA